jgi:hypothetical protein
MTSRRRVDFPQPSWGRGRGPHGQHMVEDITISGQATLEWGDQIRFLARPLARVLLGLATFMVVGIGRGLGADIARRSMARLARSSADVARALRRRYLAVLPGPFCLRGLGPGRTPVCHLHAIRNIDPEMPPTSRSGCPGHLFCARATRPEFFISIPRLAVRAPCCGALSRPRIAIRSCAGRNVRTGKLRLDWVM